MSKQLVYESESNESIIVYCFTKFELQFTKPKGVSPGS